MVARNEFDEPDAPEKPIVKDWGENFVDLAWKPPLNDGGSPITDYIIQKKEKGNPYWMNALEVPAGKTEVSLDFEYLFIALPKITLDIITLSEMLLAWNPAWFT